MAEEQIQETETETEVEVQPPPEPPRLDPEVAARRSAALAHVRKLGDPVLRTKALPVEQFDERLRDEVRRMAILMEDALGIGLAAPQVGISHRVLVYRVDPDSPVVALVNPQIDWSSRDEEISEEGCLSLPHVLVDVERPISVLVSARDEQGEELVIEASGLEARVIQHELDHLDGVLILDRTTREQRKGAMREMREREQAAAAAAGAA
jgi:peptide deformylase